MEVASFFVFLQKRYNVQPDAFKLTKKLKWVTLKK